MIKIIKKVTLLVVIAALSGCTLLGYKHVARYQEPAETTPRARVMLVGDYGGLFGIMDFQAFSSQSNGYLHAEGEKTNKPKTKKLGMTVKVPGKRQVNQVYLPANEEITISSYGQEPGIEKYYYCSGKKKMTLQPETDYVVSFDKIKASGKTYCMIQLYKVNGQELELLDSN